MENKKEPLMSAEEFLIKKINHVNQSVAMQMYANYHTQWHLNNSKEFVADGVGFIQTTSQELNSKDYQPFITADDDTVWTIDKQSIHTAIDNYIEINLNK